MNRDVRLRAELMAEDGLSPNEFARLTRSGGLTRVRRGAWARPGDLPPGAAHLRLARALARQKQEPVFSHVTAALAWGLPVDRRLLDRVWLTRRAGHGHGRTIRDAREYEASLRSDEISCVGDLIVTAVPRTVVDLARSCPLEWGVAAADAALHGRLCTRDDLLTAVRDARNRRGISRAARAVEFADPAAESPLESVSRVTLFRTGLPTPVLQHPIVLRGRQIGRGDFAWPEAGVIGECDGAAKYGELLGDGQTARDAVMAEKERENLFREAGWWMVRWGWALALSVEKLGARVGSALDFNTVGLRRRA
jgi:hypothetical protein